MLLTEAEVAHRLGVSSSDVRALRRKGLIAYLRARPVLIDEADLEAFQAWQRGLRTISEAAEMLHCSEKKVRRLRANKMLRSVRLFGEVLISEADLRARIESGETRMTPDTMSAASRAIFVWNRMQERLKK